MSVKIKLKHSSVANKAPQPADLDTGELALNVNSASPAAYLKDSAGAIVKIAGAGAIGGTPATETAAGIVELATAAETTTGTDNTRAVHPAGLKVELDKKANLASPALTGTPTAPTAAAGTNTTQVATTEFVTAAVAAENLWDRTGTVVSPTTAGDDVFTSGAVKVGGTSAAPNIQVKADGGIVANTDGLVYDAATKRLAVGSNLPQGTIHIKAAAATTPLIVEGPSSEFARVDQQGRLLVGTFSSSAQVTTLLQGNSGGSTSWGALNLARGTATPSSGQSLGELSFSDSGHEIAGLIACHRDGGTWTSGASQPSALTLSTTSDGSSSPTEQLRIASDGKATFQGVVDLAGSASYLNGQEGYIDFRSTTYGVNIRSLNSKVLVQTTNTAGVVLDNGATSWSPFTSESRLKDIIGDCDYDQAWDLIRDIQLKRYFYKDQDDDFRAGVSYLGPMADWLEKQDPELVVNQEPDENGPVRSFNQGLLGMKALAALSAALKRIETLEAEVAALKAS